MTQPDPAQPAAEIVNNWLECYACDVCGNRPDIDGDLRHGRGCYVVDEDGGGTSYAEFDRRHLENTIAAAIASARAAWQAEQRGRVKGRAEEAAKEVDEAQTDRRVPGTVAFRYQSVEDLTAIIIDTFTKE
jgi:hypothetical protein